MVWGCEKLLAEWRLKAESVRVWLRFPVIPKTLQNYLEGEIHDFLQKCTGCGVCAQVCPILPYTAADGRDPKEVVAGVLAILRGEPGNPAAASWIEACAGSGVCVKECPEPVNPRRMLLLARNKMKGKES